MTQMTFVNKILINPLSFCKAQEQAGKLKFCHLGKVSFPCILFPGVFFSQSIGPFDAML
jgi:hypothetical protein